MNETAPSGGRKRNTLLTQKKIVDAAYVELSTRGFDSARIDIIAKNAGVSRQLVYLYFGSKEGLYKAVLDLVAEGAAELLAQIDYDGSVMEVLDQFIRTVFDHQWNTAAIMTVDTATHNAIWLNSTSKVYGITTHFTGKIAEVIERGKAAGLIDPGADSSAFFAMVSMSAVGSIVMGNLWGPMLWADYASKQAMAFWRNYVVEMMIRSVLKIEGRSFPSG